MLVLKRVAARESRALAGANLAASGGGASPASAGLGAPSHASSPTGAAALIRGGLASSSPAPATVSPSGHQRRHSSSKPSSPPSDDSIAAPAAPAKTSSPTSSSGSTSTTRKRASRRGTAAASAKDRDGNAKKALPSVPSTQHLDAQAVNLASFFSLHRPISVTAPVPAPANATAFAAIFQPHPPQRRVNETLFTLSSAVRALERATGAASSAQDDADLRTAVTQASNSNAEDAAATEGEPVIVVSMQDLAQSFRPFHPPPPPAPASPRTGARTDTASSQMQSSPPRTQRKGRPAGLHTAKNPAIPQQLAVLAPHAQRVRARRQRSWLVSTAARHAAVWRAISVRRRRQLKMKKHKFKKLQKRLRNERRRLDRL